MNEFLARQFYVMRQSINDYRTGDITLNTLIQKIEGVSGALEIKEWTDAVFPIISDMEQINAVALDAKRVLTESDKADVENSLTKLEELLNRFEAA